MTQRTGMRSRRRRRSVDKCRHERSVKMEVCGWKGGYDSWWQEARGDANILRAMEGLPEVVVFDVNCHPRGVFGIDGV